MLFRLILISTTLLLTMWGFGLLGPSADMVNDRLPNQLYHPAGLFGIGIGGSDKVMEVDDMPDMYEDHRHMAEVVSIHDGDTITVKYGEEDRLRIRLVGIDSPELEQPGGEEARNFLNHLLGYSVYIEPVGTDEYGRLLANLWSSPAAESSINYHMVAQGWAYVYMTDDLLLALAEAHAQIDALGVWKDPDAIPPYEWRQMQREQSVELADTKVARSD